MGADQSAGTLRSWRELHKAALFETDANELPLRVEEARRALVFRSESFLQLFPIMAVKKRLSRMPFMLSKHWKIVSS